MNNEDNYAILFKFSKQRYVPEKYSNTNRGFTVDSTLIPKREAFTETRVEDWKKIRLKSKGQ